ncbi:dodecin domain-containing protein [Seongchinamella unica]|uniref:Dodecin domain-containing protein n=1 Tax=Seongchinamella unica TaxID=2547392 RepID=A0A4R5LRR6_9GAMM|nr:dodecin [Seongchinamella unica]TDG13551.1 dodecin domain-containing protein [Seongchinamella unica]
MSDHHTYKKIEVVGSSRESTDDAIRNAIRQTAKSVDNLEWFEVVESRGHVVDGDIGHFQVVLKLGFRIEGS